MKTKITNGVVVDGTGASRFRGEVLLENGVITALGETVSEPADEIMDANGQVICPGFIDTHSHSGLKVMENGYQAPKLRQGITTEVYGQDGVCVAPLPIRYIDSWRKYISGLDGDSDQVDWTFETTDGYLKQIERHGTSTNVAYLVPHGNVRLEVMGLTDRKPTPQELEQMQDVIRREMKSGAFGLSSGLIYIPCAYADTEELIALNKTAAALDGVFVVHQRSEADDILNSMDEILRVGRESGVRLHFSHFKACGKNNWGKIPAMLQKLDDAKAEGLFVTFDQYPYAAGSTTLSVIFPPWAHVGGAQMLMERLRDENELEKIQRDIDKGGADWDNFVDFAGWDGIVITYAQSAENQYCIGKSLAEIAKIRNTTPLKATAALFLEENGAASLVDFYGTEAHVKTILLREEQNVCTDGLLLGQPHPRVYGSYPKILGRYVREQNVLSLEKAIQKMTSKAASAIGITDRGILKPGMAADLVIFNPDTIQDNATYEQPVQFPTGVDTVLVNGQAVFDRSGMHAVPAGKILRKKC